MHWKPYTDRNVDELQAEIDHMEGSIAHDELRERYDALVWLRNRKQEAEAAQ